MSWRLGIIGAAAGGLAAVAQPTSTAPLPPDVSLSIPSAFWGEWNSNPQHCGTALNDSALTLTATRIRFYESGGQVKAVVRRGAFEVLVVSELSGEGQTWLAAHKFILNSDGSYLNSPGDNGSQFIRYRCRSARR